MKYFTSSICFLIFLLSAFFISCKDLQNNNLENLELYTISGKLSSSLISQSQNARTAFPDFSSSTRNLTYSIEAENSSTKEKVSGTFENNSPNFSIKLNLGTWTLNAKAALNGQTVCEGSKTVELTTTNPIITGLTIDLLEVYGGGTGTVSLSINLDSNTNVKSVLAEWTLLSSSSSSSTSSSNSAVFNVENGTSGTKTVVINKLSSSGSSSETNFPAGAYNLKLSFWSGASSSNETKADGLLLYSLEEIVNVFSGIETNTWQGNSVYFKESSGKKTIEVSDSMIQNFLHTTFYVGKNSSINKDASDSNTGTYFDPFATVQKAVDKIVELENLKHNSSYIIYLSESVTGSVDFSKLNSSLLNNNSLLINLQKSSSSSTNPTITSTNSQVIKMPSFTSSSLSSNAIKFQLYINGINFSGGSSSSNGSIFEVPKETTVKLTNCEIKNNTVGTYGAVYVSGGTLMFGGKVEISGNKTSGSSNKEANVYLASDQKITLDTISGLSSSVAFSTSSKIGITTQTKPNAFSNKVQFATIGGSSGTSNIQSYLSCFTSDEDYTVITESSALYIAVSGGTISVKDIPEVIFELTNKETTSSSRTLNVKAKSNGSEITPTNWDLKIYYYGVYTGKSATSSSIEVDTNWPKGNYQLFVSGVYEGFTYSAYLDFENK